MCSTTSGHVLVCIASLRYIGGLLTELEEGEEQYSMAFRAQMENIERMMGIHQVPVSHVIIGPALYRTGSQLSLISSMTRGKGWWRRAGHTWKIGDQLMDNLGQTNTNSRTDKDEMARKQKESEDYLNDVQIALDQVTNY